MADLPATVPDCGGSKDTILVTKALDRPPFFALYRWNDKTARRVLGSALVKTARRLHQVELSLKYMNF